MRDDTQARASGCIVVGRPEGSRLKSIQADRHLVMCIASFHAGPAPRGVRVHRGRSRLAGLGRLSNPGGGGVDTALWLDSPHTFFILYKQWTDRKPSCPTLATVACYVLLAFADHVAWCTAHHCTMRHAHRQSLLNTWNPPCSCAHSNANTPSGAYKMTRQGAG